MSLFDPASPWWWLFLLILIGIGVGYVYVQRQKTKRAYTFANLEVLDRVTPRNRNPLKHAPVALLLVALLLLTVALTGPQAEREVPRNRATVILVIDVSLSMQAKDVAPNRLVAAQTAAKKFADDLTEGINLGLISYAGTATTLVSPTPDREATKRAIDKLKLEEKTATGEGILAALAQIKTLNSVLGGESGAPPARIVLESDGKETVPSNPDMERGAFQAARQAKMQRIPVNTISFGTKTGTVDISGETIPVPVDDASLQKIAQISGGQAFTASSLDELNKVYDTLQKQIGYEKQKGDNSRPWVIAGTILAALALITAVATNRRLP